MRGCRFGKHPSRLPYRDFEGSSKDPSRIPKTNNRVFEGSSKDPSRIPKTNIPCFRGILLGSLQGRDPRDPGHGQEGSQGS